MVDLVRLLETVAFGIILILFLAMLWIMTYTPASMVIENHWRSREVYEIKDEEGI